MTIINKSKTPILVLLLSILTSIFWCLAQLVDVYYFSVVGAIFEILWLPMIGLLVFLPIFSLIYLVKEKINLKSLYLYSFLIILTTFLFMILRN